MDSNQQLYTLVTEYLKGLLTLNQVENWISTHEDENFAAFEARLVQALQLDLAEMLTGGLTEAQIQSDLREILADRPIAGMVRQAAEETATDSSSSSSSVFIVGKGTQSTHRLPDARTGSQLAFG